MSTVFERLENGGKRKRKFGSKNMFKLRSNREKCVQHSGVMGSSSERQRMHFVKWERKKKNAHFFHRAPECVCYFWRVLSFFRWNIFVWRLRCVFGFSKRASVRILRHDKIRTVYNLQETKENDRKDFYALFILQRQHQLRGRAAHSVRARERERVKRTNEWKINIS